MTHDDLKRRARNYTYLNEGSGEKIIRELLTALEAAEARSKADEEAMREALAHIKATQLFGSAAVDGDADKAIAKLTERLRANE